MTEPLRVVWNRDAIKELARIDRTNADRIATATKILGTNPRPPASTPLIGFPNILRLRVGDYRIVYRIDNDELVIVVISVGHRRDIYKKVSRLRGD